MNEHSELSPQQGLLMTAISLQEPWAGMVYRGEKWIETRVWGTHYRGDLLICASAFPRSPFSGKAIAIVNLVDCMPMTQKHINGACCDVYPRAHAWILEDLRKISPFYVKGQLRLFKVRMPI